MGIAIVTDSTSDIEPDRARELGVTVVPPAAQMFEEAFAPLVEAGHEVLCIVASSKLSGTINGAQAAARPRLLDILEAGPVIATHGGPGAVGIFVAP